MTQNTHLFLCISTWVKLRGGKYVGENTYVVHIQVLI